jgi:methionine-rich copper-binding protein CopC
MKQHPLAGGMKMKIVATLSVFALAACATVAFAHAHLAKSVPADGSVLKASPPSFVLTFAEPVKITAMWLQKGSDAQQKIGPLPGAAATEISVPAPKLETGRYVLSWRVVSDDGHVMPGKLSFSLNSPKGSTAAIGAPAIDHSAALARN